MTLLTTDTGWLRRMARRFADAATAEDLTQELWLASARRPPRADGVRPWLRRVARSILRERWRSETRRKRREGCAVAEAGGGESPEEQLARAELERIILEEVAALRPARREVVQLYFLEGRPTPEIARRLAVPVGTVRRRLTEAMDDLRAALDRRHGGRRALWMRALVPLVGIPAPGADGAPSTSRRLRDWALPAVAVTGAVVTLLALWSGRSGLATSPPAGPNRGGVGLSLRPQAVRLAPDVTSAAPSPDEGAVTISGDVRTAAGDPVAGAQLNLVDVGKREIVSTTASGPDGRFEIAGAAAGRYHVSAIAAAGWAGHDFGVIAAGGRAHAALIVSAGVATITGRISSATSGVAIGGARVNAVPTGAGAERFAAETNALGHYLMRVPSGRRYEVYAKAPGYNTSNLFPTVSADLTVDLPLQPMAKISGRIVDRVSGRLSAALLTIVGQPYPGEEPLVVTAPIDATGIFELSVAPGHYRLYAQAPGRLGASLRLTAVPGTNATAEITLGEGARLRGRVVGPGGEGVVGATVQATVTDPALRALGARATTAADGRYELEGLPKAELEVMARAPGHVPATARMAADSIVVGQVPELRLVPSGRVQGRVRDANGGPVSGVLVQASFQPSPAGPPRASRVLTDELGAFALDGASAGEGGDVWLAVQASDGGIAAGGPFPVRAGETSTADLIITPAAFISGRAVYPDGAPAKDVPIDAMPVGSPAVAALARATFSDGEGRFRAGPLPAGRAAVQLGWRAYASQMRHGPWPSLPSVEVSLASGADETDVVLTVPRRDGHITGEVLDQQGAALANAIVDVHLELPGTVRNDKVTRVFSDRTGRFEVRELPHGTYRLYVRHRPLDDRIVGGISPPADGLRVQLAPLAAPRSRTGAAPGM